VGAAGGGDRRPAAAGGRRQGAAAVTPAHHSSERRWRVLALVVLVLAGVGVWTGSRGTAAPVGAPPAPGALVPAPDAESSAWYCTGQSTTSGVAPGFLVLTNTSGAAVSGTITAVTDAGSSERTAVAVPAGGVVAPSIPALSSGSWESEIVSVAGGGVAVSQAVHGSSGWSQAPCQSTTSASWYFSGGTTANSDGLYVSLLNPTSTPVVVDLSFMTPSGAVHPINYQGIVLQSGQVQVEDVASEVQNVSTVSTVVSTRTGRVVASEIQVFAGPSAGLALVPGAAYPESQWAIPQAQEVGGPSEIDVFNPGSGPERVTVRLRLPSAPLAPLTTTVAGGSTWALATSSQTRIPHDETYSALVDATGGAGVVVSRTVTLPGGASAPQAGTAMAVDRRSTMSPAGMWVVPPPGTTANPAVSGAGAAYVGLVNTAAASVRYDVFVVTSSGDRQIATGTLGPGSLSGSVLSNAGLNAVIVRADGTVAVSESANPSGGIGVVTMPGIPMAAAIGR
jgi:hypothetical protein